MHVRNPEEMKSLGLKNLIVKREERTSHKGNKAFNSRQL